MTDLAGTWTLASVDGEFRAAMQVPGDVHWALNAAGVIAHPYKGSTLSLATFHGVVPPDRATDLGSIAATRIIGGDVLVFTFKGSNGMSGRDHLSPRAYKTLALRPAGLDINASTVGRHLDIRITAARPAFYVMAETAVAGRYSDNVFDLLAGETASITFTPDDPAELPRAASTLVVRDLYSSSSTGG